MIDFKCIVTEIQYQNAFFKTFRKLAFFPKGMKIKEKMQYLWDLSFFIKRKTKKRDYER